MVRVFLKGGVWKNSEDEILKAAVQKYGKQQWARVASLLNRKTAKQAKARWHEWLDPSIRKVEWSAQEEEKLLHLSKLMPAQWKTIAKTIGRTATQCQEHYEYLLDQAAMASSGGTGAAEGGDIRSMASSTVLRAGQIDSHPESKPARPDPIDMDEDEMEMLQEARARLANTQGKKAKRKQRERVLQAAKRLADLQKRRELKQAGLLSKAASKKSKVSRRQIDLGVEIPFHKPAPAGFHDVAHENERSESIRTSRLRQIDYQKVNEQQYRSRDKEAAQIRKREESRMKILQESNDKYLKQYDDHNNKQGEENLPARAYARGPLELPEPTITDTELSQLAKLQSQSNNNDELFALENHGMSGRGGVTQALLGDYTDRQNVTVPMHNSDAASTSSGKTLSRQQLLMREATKLRKLERGQTPLLSANSTGMEDDDDDLAAEDEYDQNEADMMDRKPSAKQSSSSTRSVSSSSHRLPIRDQLGLNVASHNDEFSVAAGTYLPASSGLKRGSDSLLDHDTMSIGGSTFASSKYSIRDLARMQRRAAKRARQELDAAFAALPAPQYEYELAAPTGEMTSMMEDDDDDDARKGVISTADRADIEAAEVERLRQEAEKVYQSRNSVMKRNDLPRPTDYDKIIQAFQSNIEKDDSSTPPRNDAQKMIQREMQDLIQYDGNAFPTAGNNYDMISDSNGKKKKKDKKMKRDDKHAAQEQPMTVPPKISLDHYPDNRLDEAKRLIQMELESMLDGNVTAIINAGMASNTEDAFAVLAEKNANVSRDAALTFVYTSDGWIETEIGSDNHITSLRLEYETIKSATAALRKKNDKIESKLTVMTAGYTKVADKLMNEIRQSYKTIQEKQIEETVYEQLQRLETVGGQNRIDQLKSEISTLKQAHVQLQKRYGELVVQKKRKQLMTVSPSIPATVGRQ